MTTLGPVLLVKRLTVVCDGGQCGGEIFLSTDLHGAKAHTVTYGTGYIGGQSTEVLQYADGSIEVHCSAAHRYDDAQTCSGIVGFSAEALASAQWEPADKWEQNLPRLERDQ